MSQERPVGPDSRVYLIDGSGYIFRAYHALPPLSRKSDGLPVGAVAGFSAMLFKFLCDAKAAEAPTHLAVIFDYSGRSFRNAIYDQYKANRPPPPEDLVPQFPLTRRATEAFGAPAVEQEGLEADDLIATYARQAAAKGAEVIIVSSDKDLMQLVGGRVRMFDTMKNVMIGPDQVVEKFGVPPDKVVDVQSLSGDSVDNVPGVPGIGIKTAAELINTYGSLDALLERAAEIKQPKRRENLLANADKARLSRELVRLKHDADVARPLESFGVREPDMDALLGFLKEMEFRTLTRRVEEELTGVAVTSDEAAAATGVDRSLYETVTTLDQLKSWVARAREAGVVAVDTETDALDAANAGLVGVSLAVAPNAACYIPLGHRAPAGDLLDGGGRGPPIVQVDLDAAMDALRPLLSDPAVLKVGQNLKYDIAVLRRYGVEIAPMDDTMLVSYVLAAGLRGHGMDELSERLIGHRPIAFKEVAGAGKAAKSFAEVELKPATDYAAEDADVTLRLWLKLKPELARSGLMTVYETLERPLPHVLAAMELAGVKVDAPALGRLSSDFAQRMAALEAQAYEQAGREFNLGSPKQLGDVLFGALGLPGGKKTKTGAWSTDASVLDDLAEAGHDLPKTLLEWRQIAKLKSTYTDALRDAVSPRTGRVHTSYSLAATTTGRLSSSDPNLQNIPVRTEEGRKIRTAFIAEPGHVLVSADYSQIELRLLAHYADIPALKQAFAEGRDIHAMTASEMFNTPIEGMDPMTRRRAKAINFGIIYGISAFGLANQLGIERDEAAAYINAYFEKFPGIRDYMERMKAQAREKGFVSTLFGRRIHLVEINSKNVSQRNFAERQSINAPLQGTAADIIRRAMIRMPGALEKAGLKARVLMQVHDELVFEVPESEVAATKPLVADVMSKACLPALDLSVPLVVETGSGCNWGEAH